jgi:anti-sigma regulatory factor (Ser/Thr protein kinase)
MAEPPISTTIHAPDDLLALRWLLSAQLEQRGCSQADSEAVVLATHEAAMNGLRFSGERPVYITVHFHPDRLLVCVADSGQGFDYGRWRRKALPGVHQLGGRGLQLMDQLMDDVTVSVPSLGCLVRMGKRLHLEPAGD